MKILISLSAPGDEVRVNVIPESIETYGRSIKAAGTILMSPANFLSLVTRSVSEFSTLLQTAKPLKDCIHEVKALPYLVINMHRDGALVDGRVINSSTADLAASALRERVKQIPVLVCAKFPDGITWRLDDEERPGGKRDLTAGDFPPELVGKLNPAYIVRFNSGTFKSIH